MLTVLGCGFVPPYLLERVVALHPDDVEAARARSTLELDAEVRRRRVQAPAPCDGQAPFGIHSADNTTTLPGRLARAAGAPPVADSAVDEAYHGVESSLALFAEYGRTSYDDAGTAVVATVHYGRDYANAFWDGSQLVFGDGDGRVFERFTKSVDVLGHEFTHAVVQHTAGFEYADQPGALNESVADVFASCLKQRLLGQTAAEADWLIGEGIFRPTVQGVALRSMAAPGTAYDDPVLGKDPQVASMGDYVETEQDHGGVHVNSGIPNRAFHLVATRLGGRSWEVPGRIWYTALTSGLGPHTDFSHFAVATVAAAEEVSAATGSVVAAAWEEVGVRGDGAPGTSYTPPGAEEVVEVVRTGGFAGIRQVGAVQLGADPRTAEVSSLLAHIDFRAVAATPTQPDRYVYAFRVSGREVVVNEQDLTPELDRLARVVLSE